MDSSLEPGKGASSNEQLPMHELIGAWARAIMLCGLALSVVAFAIAGVVAAFSGGIPVGELASALSAALAHAQAAKP
jgi:hypothetical protein